MERYKKQSNHGITLIVLVVTIIILLILTSITISTLFGKDGIIAQTKNSKKEAEIEGIIEKIEAELYEEKVKTGKIPNKDTLISVIEREEDGFGKVREDNESFVSTLGSYIINFSEIKGWSDYIDDGGKENPDVQIAGAQLEITANVDTDGNNSDISDIMVFQIDGTLEGDPVYNNVVMAEMNSSGKVTAVAKGIPQISKDIELQVTCIYSGAHTDLISDQTVSTIMNDGKVTESVKFQFYATTGLKNVSSGDVTYVYREENQDWETYQVLNNNKKGE